MADLDFDTNARYQKNGLPDAVKMNQLQNLLHDALIATEHVQQCAIIRRKDCSIRASSVGFNLYQDQVQILLDSFKNPPQTREEGIYFDDRQYKCVRADKNSIYGKCPLQSAQLNTEKPFPYIQKFNISKKDNSILLYTGKGKSCPNLAYPNTVNLVLRDHPKDEYNAVYKTGGNLIQEECRGLILVKTLTLMVIATYSDSMFPSVCVEAIEKLADYFKEKGK